MPRQLQLGILKPEMQDRESTLSQIIKLKYQPRSTKIHYMKRGEKNYIKIWHVILEAKIHYSHTIFSYPAAESDMAANTENFVLPWFGARSEFGDFDQALGGQCFRVFETKESFSNLHGLMTAEFTRLKTLATKLIKE